MAFYLQTRRLLSAVLLSLFAGLVGCAPTLFPPDTPSDQVIVTPFGSFLRKTILVGGQAPLPSFSQPAYIGFGPDGRLYVTTYTGSLLAITLNANDHQLSDLPVEVEEYKLFGNRLLTGFAFDPSSTADNLVLYVANNDPPIYNAPDYSGRVSRINGLGSGNVTDLIVGLPRSTDNHMTFKLQFGSDGRLYIAQGGNSNNGAPFPGLFANRSEHLLSAALLVADVTSRDFGGIQDVEVYAPGLRNPYGLCLHQNGYFYAIDQGSNKGFGGRPTPDGDQIDVPVDRPDVLHVIRPGYYYGHPVPARGQYAFHTDLADGTPYSPTLYTFPTNSIVTDVAEYTSNAHDGAMRGLLLATGFVDQNLYYIRLSEDGLTIREHGILAGGFASPLALTVGPDGTIYLLEAGGSLAFGGMGPAQITALVPVTDGGTTPSVSMFAPATTCTQCHSSLRDAAGNDVSIGSHWESTMMAQAARDPLFRAKVSSEVARTPSLADAIEAKCATCHIPMSRTQTLAEGKPVTLFGDDGLLNASHPLNVLALDGVSCTMCHQIQDVSLGEEPSFSGGYRIDQTTPSPNRLIYGPFVAPQQALMQSVSGFLPVKGPQVMDSGLCAVCHTLYTNTVDATGKVLGTFPEQTPYLEWEHSAFGDGVGQDQSCQDCHMPLASGAVVLSNQGQNLVAKAPFGQHHFVGGNAFMLKLFKANAELLDIPATLADLDATLARTLTQLRTRTASLSIDEATRSGDSLNVTLTIRNQAGHKFPSGYPARRAWVHLRVEDGSGQIVFESGAVTPDGDISGDDANSDILAWEPHYNLINDADKVQIYESVMADSEGSVTRTLLRALSYVKDNRMLPAGFDKQTADADIAVRGEAAEDTNFVGGSDTITYQVNIATHLGPLRVTAEVLYQSVPPGFVRDMKDSEGENVVRFRSLYEDADRSPSVVASVQTTVQ